jgi:tight adherence protein C
LKRIGNKLAEVLLPPNHEQRSELRQQLMHAGYSSAGALPMFVTAQVGVAVLLGLAATAVSKSLSPTGSDLLLPVTMSVCIGFLAPRIWLRQRKASRLRILNRSLPDFLDLLVACVEAGLSLEGAIHRVSMELGFAHPLLGGEIAWIQAEIELGATPDRALLSSAERTDSDVLRALATVCQQARRFGSRISSALRVHAEMLRQDREHAAEEAAQKAAVKILFPTLLLLFPATFVVLAGPAAIQIAENFSGKEAQERQEAAQ